MRVGDHVIYKNDKAEIVEIKWGLYCIRFFHSRKQIWVTPSSIITGDM